MWLVWDPGTGDDGRGDVARCVDVCCSFFRCTLLVLLWLLRFWFVLVFLNVIVCVYALGRLIQFIFISSAENYPGGWRVDPWEDAAGTSRASLDYRAGGHL